MLSPIKILNIKEALKSTTPVFSEFFGIQRINWLLIFKADYSLLYLHLYIQWNSGTVFKYIDSLHYNWTRYLELHWKPPAKGASNLVWCFVFLFFFQIQIQMTLTLLPPRASMTLWILIVYWRKLREACAGNMFPGWGWQRDGQYLKGRRVLSQDSCKSYLGISPTLHSLYKK